jgi:hypothetical protein
MWKNQIKRYYYMIAKIREKLTFDNLNKNKKVTILINVLFLVFWFVFTYKTKLDGDDFNYQVIFGKGERVSSILDIFYSQYRHYFSLNGRSVAHFIDQLYLMYDKIFFDISNAVVFCLTANVIHSLIKGKERNNALLLIIYLNYWFFGGNVFRGLLWQTGSFNYLWMILFSLLFIKKYYTIYDRQMEQHENVLKCILFFIFSVIAGWGHEIISPVVIIAIGLYFIYKHIKQIKFVNIEIVGYVGYLIGSILLIAAPGNYVKLGMITSWSFANYPVIVRYMLAFARNGYFWIYYTAPAVLYTIFVLYFAWKNNKAAQKYDAKLLRIPFYIFILLFSVFFYFFIIGWQSTNVLIPLTICNIIMVRLYDDVQDKNVNFVFNMAAYFMFMVFIAQAIVTMYKMFTAGVRIDHCFKLF